MTRGRHGSSLHVWGAPVVVSPAVVSPALISPEVDVDVAELALSSWPPWHARRERTRREAQSGGMSRLVLWWSRRGVGWLRRRAEGWSVIGLGPEVDDTRIVGLGGRPGGVDAAGAREEV